MEPDIVLNSVAFLAKAGYSGEGFYALFHSDGVYGGIYFLEYNFNLKSWNLRLLNWPDDFNERPVNREDFEHMDLRRVVGVARPYTSEFGAFLCTWARS